MKTLILLFPLLLLPACAAVDKELQNALAYGEIIELNDMSPEVRKDLFIRLYRAPIHKAGCFTEASGICQYRYFLAVSTLDEHPATNLFELNTIGEIVEIEWRDEHRSDYAELDMTFNRYTQQALENHPALENTPQRVLVQVNAERLLETTLHGN